MSLSIRSSRSPGRPTSRGRRAALAWPPARAGRPRRTARRSRAGGVAAVAALLLGAVAGGVALATPAGAAAGSDRLLTGETLAPGQSLVSNGGAYRLTMQPDGNLVLYASSGPVWSDGTYGAVGSRLVMQTDGNLVVYSTANKPLWYTRTWDVDGASLVLQSDGNLVVYSGAHTAMWARFGMPVPANDPATVTKVVDGDTVEVNGNPQNIRLNSLNAMETGECRADQAKAWLTGLLAQGNNGVRLIARDRTSMTDGANVRPRRSIVINGTGTDPAAFLVQQGLALWFPNRDEFQHNAEYATLAAQAAFAKRGLWDPNGCGAGPSPTAKLRVDVSWSGDESATVTNVGAGSVNLGGWWLRDGLQRYGADGSGNGKRGYTFAAGTALAPGQTLVVHTGSGTNQPGQRYWGVGSIFDNPTGRPESMGDGAYLFDPDGDIRAAHQYGPVEFHFSA